MPGNSFGKIFKITTFGESHGGSVGVIIDGCPANLALCEDDIQPALDRRKPGQSSLTTPRNEADQIKILSGVFEGKTTGTPLMMLADNKDMRPADYDELSKMYRPSHADYSYDKKYGLRDWRGSGRASARETLARVAAGAVAQKYLRQELGVESLSFVEQIGNIRADINHEVVTTTAIDASLVRCPDTNCSNAMIQLIEQVKTEQDSIGGVIKGVIRNVPAGLGEPVFDKLPALLAHAMLSINAVKGFEIGEGFGAASMRGSEHNDSFIPGQEAGQITLRTNRAGGTLGGISTGADIVYRVVFKPVATISKAQDTVDKNGAAVTLEAKGRHDPCVLPRAVPIVDAMAALVVMDLFLLQRRFGSVL